MIRQGFTGLLVAMALAASAAAAGSRIPDPASRDDATVSHFLGRFELRESRETGGFDADALRALQSYPWPGNVRELESEVHRLVLSVGQGRRICHHHLARRIRDADPMALDEPLQRILQRVEIALIRQRLQQKPTKSATARSLGITREALYAKMRRLGMGTGTG